MELIIAAYMALMGASYYCGSWFDKAYTSKIKRLGYISTEPELYEEEAALQSVMNLIKELIICAIPIINLLPIFILFGFESFSDVSIKSDLEEGKLRRVEPKELSEEQPGYLQKRIDEVKRLQLEMGKKNVPRTFSELSYDEKIDVLLHELELAYMEKAKAEGFDISEVETVLEPMPDNNAGSVLKKKLPH